MNISNMDFLQSTLNNLLVTGLSPVTFTTDRNIAEEIPTTVLSDLIINFDKAKVDEFIGDVVDASDCSWCGSLHVGEISVRTAGKAHLLTVLLFEKQEPCV